MSHKLGHCGLVSYESLGKVRYNKDDQFYIFLFLVVQKKKQFCLKFVVFTCFSKIKYFFFFHIERNPALATCISIFLTTQVITLVQIIIAGVC